MPLVIQCEYCGKEFDCIPSRYKKAKHHYCSKQCQGKARKKANKSNPDYYNCECVVCGKKFHLKPYHLNKYSTHTCSPECTKEQQRRRMTGENNHQYGLKGELNSSFKFEYKRITTYGYYEIYVPNHPFCDKDGYVLEHRIIAEKYLLNDENSMIINGEKFLKKEYVVHHKDFNRLNNDVYNLEVMTKGEHTRFHNSLIPRERDSLGRFLPKNH